MDTRHSEREPGQRHSNKNIRSLIRTKEDNIFHESKERYGRTYGERVDDRLEAGYRELKRFGKTQSGGETTVQLGGDITKGKRRNANRALKEALGS